MTMPDQTRDPIDGEYELQFKVIEAAHQLAAVIKRGENPLAEKLIADLNQQALDLELIGQPVLFTSKTVEWMREDFDFETGETKVDEYTALPTEGTFSATITGFDRIGTSKGDVLLYKLQHAAMDTTQTAFITAFTPVDVTKIVFTPPTETGETAEDLEVDDGFILEEEFPAHSKKIIERLRTFRDGDFQEDLTDFLELHKKTTYPSPDKMRELGILATSLLTYDYIEIDPEARAWLLTEVLSLFTVNKSYHIGGHFIADDPTSDKALDPFRQNKGKYRVTGAVLIPEYEVSFGDVAEPIEGTTRQVALAVASEGGTKEFVPIRYITEVSDWSHHYLGKTGCTEARQRFLDRGPKESGS